MKQLKIILKMLKFVFCICWAGLVNGQTTWYDDGSVKVIGEEVFIYKTPYNNDNLSHSFNITEISKLEKPEEPNKYGLIVNGIINPQAIPTEISEIPDTDGVTLIVSPYSFKTNEPLEPIYSTFATDNKDFYQEGKLDTESRFLGQQKVPSTNIRGRFLNGLTDLLVTHLSASLGETKVIPDSYSLKDKYPIYIQVRVKNATLHKINIPGVFESAITPKELFKDHQDDDLHLMKKIFNNPKDYNYGFVAAHRGYWAEPGIPENTIKAFERAYEIGADIIEIDVRLTKDNIPVACHDEYLYRLYDLCEWLEGGSCEAGKDPCELMTKFNNKKFCELKISDINLEDFKKLKTKDRFGTIVDIYPNTIDEVLKKFSHQLISLDIKDEDVKASGGLPASNRWTECFEKCIKAANDNNVLSNTIIKGKPKAKYTDATKLFKKIKINTSGVDQKLKFSDFIFTPVMYAFFNDQYPYNERYNEWVNLSSENSIKVAETHYKYNTDPLLKLTLTDGSIVSIPELLHQNNVRVGSYNFYADTPTGVLVMEKDGKVTPRVYTPDINYEKEGTEAPDSALDNRGNIDWTIKKGGVNYIIHDRPDMVIKLFKAYGMRSVIPITTP